jgi:hypothetical protein
MPSCVCLDLSRHKPTTNAGLKTDVHEIASSTHLVGGLPLPAHTFLSSIWLRRNAANRAGPVVAAIGIIPPLLLQDALPA